MTNMTDPPIPDDSADVTEEAVLPTNDTVDQGDEPDDVPLF